VNPSWSKASLDGVARTTAEFRITGDKDLLALRPFRAIAVVTPAQFLTLHTAAWEPA